MKINYTKLLTNGGADKKLDKIRNTKEDNYLVLR